MKFSADTFTVAVRLRPENEKEKKTPSTPIIKITDDKTLIFDPLHNDNIISKRKKGGRPVLTRKAKNMAYVFDCVLDQYSSQMNVFEATLKPLLDSVLEGRNCTCFAYGATGAGKTHTMVGTVSEPGGMILTIQELYSRIEQLKDEKTIELSISYMEVYNEQLKDLLEPKDNMPLRESRGDVIVSGLSEHIPKDAKELFEMLELGNSRRTQHPTDANATSSRSHAIFQVKVTQREKIERLKSTAKIANLMMVDLAGSERATSTRNMGARMREGANINKSLLSLGNCLNALYEGKKHVPFRDSKLTRILKSSLGGNCKTVMIANVSPSRIWFEDTLNTLKYANRAKDIKTHSKTNEFRVDKHLAETSVINRQLEEEIKYLKKRLAAYEGTTPEEKANAQLRLSMPSSVLPAKEMCLLRQKITKLTKDYAMVKRKLHECDRAKYFNRFMIKKIERYMETGISTKGASQVNELKRVNVDLERNRSLIMSNFKKIEREIEIFKEKDLKKATNDDQQKCLLLELGFEMLQIDQETSVEKIHFDIIEKQTNCIEEMTAFIKKKSIGSEHNTATKEFFNVSATPLSLHNRGSPMRMTPSHLINSATPQKSHHHHHHHHHQQHQHDYLNNNAGHRHQPTAPSSILKQPLRSQQHQSSKAYPTSIKPLGQAQSKAHQSQPQQHRRPSLSTSAPQDSFVVTSTTKTKNETFDEEEDDDDYDDDDDEEEDRGTENDGNYQNIHSSEHHLYNPARSGLLNSGKKSSLFHQEMISRLGDGQPPAAGKKRVTFNQAVHSKFYTDQPRDTSMASPRKKSGPSGYPSPGRGIQKAKAPPSYAQPTRSSRARQRDSQGPRKDNITPNPPFRSKNTPSRRNIRFDS